MLCMLCVGDGAVQSAMIVEGVNGPASVNKQGREMFLNRETQSHISMAVGILFGIKQTATCQEAWDILF